MGDIICDLSQECGRISSDSNARHLSVATRGLSFPFTAQAISTYFCLRMVASIPPKFPYIVLMYLRFYLLLRMFLK